MSLSTLIFPFSISAFAYLLLAAQVLGGFPPLYRKLGAISEGELKTIVPLVFLLMSLMAIFALTEISTLFLTFGLVSCWGALRIRSMLNTEASGPLPWLFHPITVKWPMFVFDVWTLGISGLIMLLSI